MPQLRFGLVTGAAGLLLAVPAASAANSRPASGQAFAVLSIPAIQLRLTVVEDNGALEPDGHPVHYRGTALPGDGATVAIAAHHQTHGQPFGRLDQLRRGDAVIITMFPKFGGGTYRYRVTGQRIYRCLGSAWEQVKRCDSASVGFTELTQDKLILTTCDQHGYVRRFVYAFPSSR